MEEGTIIAVSVLGAGCLLLLVLVAVLFSQVSGLRRRLDDIFHSGRLRVQKAKLDTSDKNHAFHNPTISPDEELARRGFSMYNGDDVESSRSVPTERQTGGQLLDELSRELDSRRRHQQQLHDEVTRDIQQHQRRSRQELQQQLQQQQQQQQQLQLQQQQQQQLQQQQQQQQQQQPPTPPYQTPKQSQQNPPPFLLQSIEENKKKTRQNLANPVANPRNTQLSETNPNFIY